MAKTKWLDLTQAAQVTKLSPHTLRRLVTNTEGGVHSPLIPHKREGSAGRSSDDSGRRGRILIDERTCKALRANPPS
jgi:hypothetical protein